MENDTGSLLGGNPEEFNNNPAPASGNSDGWVSSLPDEYKGMIENKGWKDPADVVKSYQHLESLMGADKAGRGMVLPKDEGDVEGFNKIYNALGRPETVEGYDLMTAIGNAEYDKGMLDKVGAAMHEAGLSSKQAQSVVKAYQQEYAAIQEGMRQQFVDEQIEVKATISTENLELARRGFRYLDLPVEKAVDIEAYLGPKAATELFGKIGRLVAEDKMPATSKGNGQSFSSGGAEARREQLFTDQLFLKRYMGGDPAALQEIERLNIQIAKGMNRAE